jgi:hypothetical protein
MELGNKKTKKRFWIKKEIQIGTFVLGKKTNWLIIAYSALFWNNTQFANRHKKINSEKYGIWQQQIS